MCTFTGKTRRVFRKIRGKLKEDSTLHKWAVPPSSPEYLRRKVVEYLEKAFSEA
ncbi:MAG: hypothetical protein QXH02_04455 [Desulfurococcaceae archaeon]